MLPTALPLSFAEAPGVLHKSLRAAAAAPGGERRMRAQASDSARVAGVLHKTVQERTEGGMHCAQA